MKTQVLIICTGNSCRSQMAEGLLRSISKEAIEVFSAGTHPSFVHPMATEVMKEIGIDISSHTSKSVNTFLDHQLDYIITVCDSAKARCPVFPGAAQRLHMPVEDPIMYYGDHEQQRERFRKVRDDIQTLMEEFLKNKLHL